MRHIPRVFLGMAVILFGFCLSSSADTLQMKNGDVIRGKYLGGSERAVQFGVNGKIELYTVSQVLSITFTGAPAAGSFQSAGASVRSIPAGNTYGSNPSSGGVIVPAGTRILIRMIDSVDSSRNHVGDKFLASLEADLVADGITVAPKGTDVYGRLAEAQEAGRVTGKSQLRLELTDLLIHDKLQPILTGDYEIAGEGRGGDTVRKAAGGAVLGALIGAIAGGGKGAAIGAGVGGGAGTAVNVMTRGEQVRVPSETVLEFRLQQPFRTPGF